MTSATLTNTRTLFLPGPNRRGMLLGFLGTLAVGLFLGTGVSLGMASTYDGRILPGVEVGGVSLGGLDRAAATARLESELPAIGSGAITVVVDGTAVEVADADIGRGYHLDAMLDAAFGVGRSGNPLTDGVARLRMLAHETSLPFAARPDGEAAINSLVADLAARFNVVPVSAAVTYDPSTGFEVTPARDGARLDRVALREALILAASRSDLGPVTITASTIRVAPAVSTSDAAVAAGAVRWMTAAPLPLQVGEERLAIAVDALAALLTFERSADGALAPVVDEAALATLLETYAARIEREPKSAGFTWNANGVSGVEPGVEGRALDVDGSVRSVVSALQERASGTLRPIASLAVVTTQPALSTEQAQAAMSKMRRIGTWTTYYVPGEGNYWNKNIHIPAWDIDKLVLAPGEWFSFWDDIGPMTLERGYGYGGAIIGGRSVRNGALGGGVCSTSTTLFNAAMRSGLEIGERTNHSYYISRYPVGLDATVLKTDTYETDMTFRNDTANPIVIRSYTGNGWVRFDIWGVPDGRTVTLSKPITSNHGTARETTVLNNSLAPGTSRRVEYPHDGFDSVVTRTVRDANGNVIWTNVWQSHYRTVNGITEVGPAAPATPPPPSPSPAPG